MKTSTFGLVFSAIGVAVAVGCGSDPQASGFDAGTGPSNMGGDDGGTDPNGFGGGGPSGSPLTLDPKNTTVIIDTSTMPTTPGTISYKVSNGATDLTSGASFSLSDPSLGTFAGATFTSGGSLPMGVLGKSAVVSATTPNGTALGSLTVVALRKTGASKDFFFLEPYKDAPSPATDTLKFSTNIQQVDVAFVMDTTGSMGNEIDGLTTALGGTLLTELQMAIPNVGLAVVSHKDVADGNKIVKVYTPITTTLATAQTAVTAMQNAGAIGGGDLPEAQVNGMDFALTGAAIVNGGTTLLAAHTPPAGGYFGGVDFRPGSVPVVVEITDANWHDPSAGVTAATLASHFNTANARFINMQAAAGSGNENQGNTLSDATHSSLPTTALTCTSAGQCCNGSNGAARAPSGPGGTCRLNYLFDATSGNLGTAFTNSIVQAIKGISVGSQFDVTTKLANDPTNMNGLDATVFIKALRAKDEGDMANGCPPHAATDSNGDGIKDTFTAVVVGTPVCFEVIPAENMTVPPTKDPQFYKAIINVVGVQGNVALDSRSVLFLVPPTTPGVN